MSGPTQGDCDVCVNCGRPITFDTYRNTGGYEPDYDPDLDPIVWRHRGGYAACGVQRYAAPGHVQSIDAKHLARQREWSSNTFGPGARTAGVLDHIRKELAEIEAAPDDLSEWADVIILAFDGAWRAGWEPQAIIDAIIAKQERNEARQWPDWHTADPDAAIEHVRSES